MDKLNTQHQIIALVGATGTGKSALVAKIAQVFPINVINFDSRQVYADFPIVTAQPTAQEQKICPHYEYGFLATEDKISVQSMSERIVTRLDTIEKKTLPVLVGGTGFYLTPLLQGLSAIPAVKQEIRDDVVSLQKKHGTPHIYNLLELYDTQSAKRLHATDTARVCRAYEVYLSTGKTISYWHQQPQGEARVKALQIGIIKNLDDLTPRLAVRIDQMIENGAVAEIEKAFEKCPQTTMSAWTGIGCSQLLEYVQKKISLADAKKEWLLRTRQYAKRQMTWFRKDTSICWVQENELDTVCEKIGNYLK